MSKTMNYQKEKRPVDETAEETYSWLKRKVVFIKKARLKTWQGIILLAFVMGMASYLILSIEIGTHLTSKAVGEAASLSLSPSAINVNSGESFNLAVRLDANGNNVVVTRAIINYDTNNFSLTNYNISSSAFDSSACASQGKTACEIINNDIANGIIDITLAKPSPGTNAPSGLIANLTFQALQATTDNITISFTPGSYSDSNVILDGVGDDGAGTNILSSVTDTIITINPVEGCGDGYCAGIIDGEDCNACSADCISGQGGTCSACWKGVCDGNCNPRKETLACADCAENYCCGDSICDGLENVENCPIDCACLNDSDCDDNETCTRDVCSGGVCENNWPVCGLNDDCCAPDCTFVDDPDCINCGECWKGVCDGTCHATKETTSCPDCK